MASVIDKAVGYNAIATCMDSDPDLSIYRRFGALNGRNLLYLQSELRELESQLHDLDADANDISKGNDVWSTPRSWYALNRAGGEKHLEIVMKLRLRLDDAYFTSFLFLMICLFDFTICAFRSRVRLNMWSILLDRALKHQAWLLDLKAPRRRPWMNLVKYIRENRAEMSDTDAHFLHEEFRGDLVALASDERELLSALMGKCSYGFFGSKNDKSKPAQGQMISISDEKIRNYVRILAIVVSSVLPILAIVALNFIKSSTARLGAIVAFSALCSATLAILSNAKNAEIIAATAAYAAVQVVFVSGNATSS